jgi:Na+-transporting methylmalonyl-CoA/oxaloacetate decarboxylase gamma subunit
MTTPLSTDRIVLAKWWGAYRVVPALALLPAIGALVVAFAQPEIPFAFTRIPQPHDPVGWIDRVAFACLPTALFLAQAAVVTSFGLALATWMRRLGRAIAASVATYAFIAIGWLVTLELGIVPSMLSRMGLIARGDRDAWKFFSAIEVSICPLGAQISPLLSMDWASALSRYAFYVRHVIVLLFMIGVAFVFLGLTLATFNRSMGRMPERPRRASRPPRKFKAARGPHRHAAGSREPVLTEARVTRFGHCRRTPRAVPIR